MIGPGGTPQQQGGSTKPSRPSPSKVSASTVERLAKKQREALGVQVRWDGDDRVAVMSHNRIMWRRLKKKNGWTGALREIPGFTTSLQSLYDQGYSLTDIAAFFGVSTERCRQWFNRLGIKRDDIRGSLARVWSDELNRFTVVHPRTLQRMQEAAYDKEVASQKRERDHEVALRCAQDVDVLKRLNGMLGRSPYRVEILEAMGFHVKDHPVKYIRVAQRWGKDRSTSYAQAWSGLYRAAGLVKASGTGVTLRYRESQKARRRRERLG